MTQLHALPRTLTWCLQERDSGIKYPRCELCSVSQKLGDRDLADHRESIYAHNNMNISLQDTGARHSLDWSIGMER